MATTTWFGGSGSWNTAADWNDGVPSSTDTAIFPTGSYTVSGIGTAGTIEGQSNATVALYGTFSTNNLVLEGATLNVDAAANLIFSSGTADNSSFVIGSGGDLSGGTLALSNSSITGSFALSEGLRLSGTDIVSSAEYFVNYPLSGSGVFQIGSTGEAVRAPFIAAYTGVDSFTGSVLLVASSLDFQTGFQAGSSSTTNIAPSYVTKFADTISASSQSLQIFVDGDLTFTNATSTPRTGQTTIVGAVGANVADPYDYFAHLSVNGGDFSLTVFAGDLAGQIVGGSAGNNIIVAGASAAAYGVGVPTVAPSPVTVMGSGNGDLLVATGRLNNLFTAGSGNETLFGGNATGNNQFFGGSGADLIVAGTGQDTIVNGKGSATINGGSGSSAIFAGSGQSVVIGGTGNDYIQAGSGAVTVFTGSGGDVLGIVNGQGSGMMAVAGFRVGTDLINAQGYTTAPVSASIGGSTILTFSDATQVTLYGVAQLPNSSIV